MRVIFCGTPQFAVPTLKRLLAEGFAVELVLTNPDEPRGRGEKLTPPPVKTVATEAGLEIYQPKRLTEPTTVEFLSKFRPDTMVVIAYGHILPKWMIDLPRVGCINLHASLLPKYRGAAPIQWALINGEQVTGVTTMMIDPGLDTGDILLQRKVDIREDDTSETLSRRMSELGAELMVETLRRLDHGVITPQAQDHTLATLAPMLKKEDGRIDWNLPAQAISWRVRGLALWPGAFSTFRGKNLHFWSAAPLAVPVPPGHEPGALIARGGVLWVVCGEETVLEVKELQVEGRKRLHAREFLNGIRLGPGERLL